MVSSSGMKTKKKWMSKYYKLKLQFTGSKYLGWQIQKDFSPTVQGELNKACSEIFKNQSVHTIGSGRTDTGVHSLGHIVRLEAPFEIPDIALKKGLNSILPEDIRVTDVERTTKEFKPTNDALKKEYFYLFTNNESTSAFQTQFIPNYRHELNIEKMKEACKLFVGEHDFKNFYCTGSELNSTVREIYECSLDFHNLDFHEILPSHYIFKITGNGFLKQMVRLIVGTIWEVGRGKVTIEELALELQKPGEKKLGITAPAAGLFKNRVWYS